MAQINSNQNGKLNEESINPSRSSIESANVKSNSRGFSGNTQQSAGRSSVEGEEWNEEQGMDEGLENEESLSASDMEDEEDFQDSEYKSSTDESLELPRKEQSINKDRRSSDKLR